MALKSIVEDVGADRGIIFSDQGYQPGAIAAVRDSNITLVTSIQEFDRTASTISSAVRLSPIDDGNGPPIYRFTDESKPQHLHKYGNFLISASW